MGTFAYKGVTAKGRPASGTIDADSPRSARSRLREQGILASNVSEATAAQASTRQGWQLRGRISARDLSRTMRQLSTLLAAGIPLVDAITTLRNRQTRPALRSALEGVRNDLVGGDSLERAIAKHPEIFPDLYAGMIRAGEASGGLDAILARIAEHAEATARLQGQFRSAMTYPTIMMVVGGGIVTFLLAYVVPQVTRVFLESGQSLPWPTRMLMTLGGFVATYGLYIAGAMAVAALGVRAYAQSRNGRRRVERIAFATPWLGTVVRNVAMARFAHTLATMISGGMPLVDALEVSRSVTGSELLNDALAQAKDAVSEGEPLAPNLDKSGLFNPMVVDMINVGERSGDIANMLDRAAAALDEEVGANVETMAAMLEPIMILAMAGVVLFVVLAVLLPVFEMNQLVR